LQCCVDEEAPEFSGVFVFLEELVFGDEPFGSAVGRTVRSRRAYLNCARQAGLSFALFFSMQAVMRGTSGTASRHSRIASARQARRCSSVPAACAALATSMVAATIARARGRRCDVGVVLTMLVPFEAAGSRLDAILPRADE